VEQCPLTGARELLKVALSSIIVPVSFQSSETRQAKVRREVKPYDTLKRWKKKVEDTLELSSTFRPPIRWRATEVHQGDARDLNFLDSSSVDLVVTSPPYPNTYDYGSFQWLRLLWLGLVEGGSSGEYGVRSLRNSHEKNSTITDYEQELGVVLSSVRRVLRPAGICSFVVETDTAESIQKSAATIGFKVLAVLAHSAFSTTGSTYPRSAASSNGESIVLLQRN